MLRGDAALDAVLPFRSCGDTRTKLGFHPHLLVSAAATLPAPALSPQPSQPQPSSLRTNICMHLIAKRFIHA